MFKIADRVKEFTTTSGTGSIILGGAIKSFQSFSSGIGDGNSTFYAIQNQSQWEVGVGTYTASSNTLSRDTVYVSSNNNQKIVLSGLSTVFCTYPASKAVIVDDQNKVGIGKSPTYQLDVFGSGRFDALVFGDGTIQRTSPDSLIPALIASGAAISGWADSTMTARDAAVSGWARSYIEGQDHSATSVSGWANFTMVPYSGAFKNVNLGNYSISSSGSTFSSAQFYEGLATNAGKMVWNDGDGTVDLTLKGGNTIAQLGQEELALCYNGTNSTLNLGQVVYISGAQGQRPSINLADYSTEYASSKTFGVVAETITNGAEGFVSTFGVLDKVNTLGIAPGTALWLGPSGTFTATKPVAPKHLVFVGYSLKESASAGRIFINVQNGYELDELHDVLITNKASGDILKYDSSVGLWKNSPFSVGSGLQIVNGAISTGGSGNFTNVLINTGTITSNSTALDISQTWNNAATTFTASKINITDTASNASSLLMDLQVNGVGKFGVKKNGDIWWYSNDGGWGIFNEGFGWMGLRANNGVSTVGWTGGLGFGLISGNAIAWNNSTALGVGVSNYDLRLYRDAAATLAQRNGTNAQRFNLYGTYSDVNNYRRFYLKADDINGAFSLGVEGLGSGANSNTLTINASTVVLSGGSGDIFQVFEASNYLGFAIRSDSSLLFRNADYYSNSRLINIVTATNNSTTEATWLWNRPQQGINFGMQTGIDVNVGFNIGTGGLNEQYGVLKAVSNIAWNDGYHVTLRGGLSVYTARFHGDIRLFGGSGYSNASGNVILGHDGTSQIGNVGVATIAPTAKLHIADTWNSNLSVTGASGNGTTATLTFATTTIPIPIGSTIVVASINPSGYNGTFVVTASTTTSVSYANTTTSAYVSGGTIQQQFTGLLCNVTDTASASGSSLADLQVGGSSKLRIAKTGTIYNEATASYSGAFDSTYYGGLFFRTPGSLSWNLCGIGGIYRGVQIFQEATPVITCCAGYPTTFSNPYNAGIGFWDGSDSTRRTSDVVLNRDAAGVLAQRFGTNSQTFRIYNTTDSGIANYERAKLAWESNTFVIGTEIAGTSVTPRNIALVGGNVGIGTTGPSAKLAVIKDYTWGASIPTTGQGQPGIGVAGRFNVINNNRTFYFDVVSSPTVYAEFSTYEYGTNVPFAMVFQGNGGNVGISNLSPAAKLDILDTTGAGSGSLQASALNIAQTWNTTGTPTLVKCNVVDTSSNAASLLMDLQVGSVSKFKVDKAGKISISTGPASPWIDIVDAYGTARIAGSSGSIAIYASAAGLSNEQAVQIHWLGAFGVPSVGFYGWLPGSDLTTQADTRIYRDAAGTLAQRNSTNAQTYRLYGTYTNASEYRRLSISSTTAGAFTINAEGAGTGASGNTLELQTGGTQKITIDASGRVLLNSYVGVTSNATFLFAEQNGCFSWAYGTRSSISSSADGVIMVGNNARTSFDRFQLGGTTSSFPAIKRNGTAINFRLADDSADAPITASQATLSTGTITASTPALDISQTWNNSGVAFTAAKINVTNTASINNSSLLDLQVSGVSKFNASLRGDVAFTGALSAGATANFLIPCDHAIASRTTGSGANSDSILDVASNTGHTGRLQSWTRAGTIVASIGTTGSASFNGYAYVYNTADSALNNYERGKLEWSSNVFRIGTEKAGTGSARALELQTDGTTRLTIGTDGSASFSGTISATSNMVLDPAGTATLRSMTFGLISLSGFARGAINGASTKTYFGSSVAQDVVLGANARQDLTINGTTGAATLSATLDLTIRTVTYGATMAIDAALGNKIAITLAGNGTISNPTNAVDGRVLVFRLRQDATGSRIPVWDTKYTFVGDLATVTLSTAANAIDRVAFEYDSTNDKWYCISFIKGS